MVDLGVESSSIQSFPLCQVAEVLVKELLQTPILGPTCTRELVGQLHAHSLGEVEVVIILIDAVQEQWDMLEDDGMPALPLSCDAQLLVQPAILGLLQGWALGGIVPELRVEHQEQDTPNPEAEVVISPRMVELLDGLGCGDVAQVMVATDKDQWDLSVKVFEHPLQVLSLLLAPGGPWKTKGHILRGLEAIHVFTNKVKIENNLEIHSTRYIQTLSITC